MKKIAFMAAAILSTTALAGSSLTAHAASKPVIPGTCNTQIIQIGQSCDLESFITQLKECFSGIQFPGDCIPQLPECPEAEIPSPELPEPPEAPTPEAPGPEHPEQESPTPEQAHPYIQEIVTLVNAERAKEGLSPLTLNLQVSAAAQVRSSEIVSSFSHTRPDGSSFVTALQEQNISYRRAGENIAWGQKSPTEVMNSWMNSSGHRANIMNSHFTTIGVGYYSVNGVNYWCQLFTS